MVESLTTSKYVPERVNETEAHINQLMIDNEFIQLTVCPEFGGKITSIKSKETGTEFLKQPDFKLSEIAKPEYGFDFLPPYAFGFDECFPTVASCTYLSQSGEKLLPDHGEVWCKEWSVIESTNSIKMKVKGEGLDYELSKTISLHQNLILISYDLLNSGKVDFQYLWSSHPLLQVEEKDEIILPEEIKAVEVYYSTNSSLKKGDKSCWPLVSGSNFEFNKVANSKMNFASKAFVSQPGIKKGALYRLNKDESIIFDFTNSGVEHLGIWMTYGGWPAHSNVKDVAVALEPTTSCTDDLSEAIVKKIAKQIGAGQTAKWSLKISIEKGRAELE